MLIVGVTIKTRCMKFGTCCHTMIPECQAHFAAWMLCVLSISHKRSWFDSSFVVCYLDKLWSSPPPSRSPALTHIFFSFLLLHMQSTSIFNRGLLLQTTGNRKRTKPDWTSFRTRKWRSTPLILTIDQVRHIGKDIGLSTLRKADEHFKVSINNMAYDDMHWYGCVCVYL